MQVFRSMWKSSDLQLNHVKANIYSNITGVLTHYQLSFLLNYHLLISKVKRINISPWA